MDTGSYMQNQMDNLIESGIHQMEEFYDELTEKIESYIKECGYTWTIKTIIEQYHKSKNGEYISFTAKDVINKFKSDLDKIF